MGASNIKRIEKNEYPHKPAYQFSSTCFDFIEEFPSNKKFIPDWIINSLNFKSLAVWIMDDGSVDHNKKTIVISTCSFDLESYEKIQRKMLKLGVEAEIKKYDGYLCIVIGKDGYNFIMDNIYKYIPNCMEYKLIPSKRHLPKHPWQSNEKFDICTFPISKITEIKYTKKKKTGFGLYDLEIEGNHNFITASGKNGMGVLVHNCHHSSASTWENLLLAAIKAEYVYNLTATPFRADGMDLGIHAFGGPTVFELDAKWGIENGWLAPLEVFFSYINPKDDYGNDLVIAPAKTMMTAYSWLSSSPQVLEFLVLNITKAVNSGKKVIVLFRTVKAGAILKKRLGKSFPCGLATSNNKKIIQDFRDNKIQVMISNDRLVGEGVDIPDADLMFTVIQNSSETTTKQVVGRILRKFAGKEKGVLIDVVMQGYRQFENAAEKRLKVYNKIANKITITGRKRGRYE